MNLLKNMFTPLKIGKMELKNRFIVSPMVMNCCNEDGTATEKFIAYHEEKAKGGWGLIVTEDYAVDPTGRSYQYLPGLWNDDQIPSHRELTKRVHQAGAKIFAQIFHAGRQTESWITGTQVWAPSPIPCPNKKEPPHEMTLEEVKDMIAKFGDAALRAKKAGFDGVQIHGGHGYLVSEFASAYSNKRVDEYGGCLTNRLRFPLEIIADIREKCGDDFCIDYKISGDEAAPGGNNIEDVKTIATLLEHAGIDSLNVSIGVYESWFTQVPPAAMGHGWIADFAAEVKKVVDIPVTTVGRINDPLIAETIIKSGKADACYMGRASLADPYMPENAKKGDFEDIIRCTGCKQGCTSKIDAGYQGGCMLNPRTVKEDEIQITKTIKPKKILVAGGGPAGAEAAIVAAERGHNVTLYEMSDRLGGMFYVAAVPPYKGEISAFIAWQSQKLKRLGVEVIYNTPLTREVVQKENPDSVIIATGSEAMIPAIKGCANDFVTEATVVLRGQVRADGNLAVIGGGLVGGETAHYLATHGNQVTVIEMAQEILKEEPGDVKKFILDAYKEHDVDIFVDSCVQSINEDGTITINTQGKDADIGPFDKIVMAIGMNARKGLADEIKDFVDEIAFAGDALSPGNALDAIENGYMAGYKI